MPYDALSVNILIFGLYAVGFNLLFGYTGMLSFGHAAFLGVGSYLTGIAVVSGGWPWWAAIAAGVICSSLVGVVIGFMAIRTRGIYFSMVTLALAQIIYYIFYKADVWTGGENGLRGVKVDVINLFGFRINFMDPLNKYYVILIFSSPISRFKALLVTVAILSVRVCYFRHANALGSGGSKASRTWRRCAKSYAGAYRNNYKTVLYSAVVLNNC